MERGRRGSGGSTGRLLFDFGRRGLERSPSQGVEKHRSEFSEELLWASFNVGGRMKD